MVAARALSICVLLLASTIATHASAQIPSSGPGSEGVRGILLDPAYEPLEGYRVRVVGSDGVGHVSGPIDSKGRFWISQLPPGRYEVQVLSPDGRMCDSEIPGISVSELGELNFTTVLSAPPVCEGELVPDEPAGTTEPPAQPADPEARPKKPRKLARILVATGIGIGAILFFDDSDEPTVSPIVP